MNNTFQNIQIIDFLKSNNNNIEKFVPYGININDVAQNEDLISKNTIYCQGSKYIKPNKEEKLEQKHLRVVDFSRVDYFEKKLNNIRL